MNTITRIGEKALEKYFSKKTVTIENRTSVTKVIFSKKPIELEILRDFDFTEEFGTQRSFKIWSIGLGVISLKLKKDQTLLSGIVKKLNKLQREEEPSHVIIGEHIIKDDLASEVSTVWTIYRLTDYQEGLIFNDYLLPAINKRDDKMEEKWRKENEQYEKEYQAYLVESANEKLIQKTHFEETESED